MVGHLPTLAMTGNGELGFDTGEGGGRHQTMQQSRHWKPAQKLLEDARPPPEWQRPKTDLFPEIDNQRFNM